jgi:ribonuclease BN (tRNA processing enzyme)
MRVTFLGTGSAMPTGERFQTGLLLEPGGDEAPLVVDCGSGVVHALAGTDPGYEAPGTVLLTHHHLDHVSDLLPLVKARWLAGEEELTMLGPEGTADLVDGLLGVHEYMQGKVELTVRELTAGEPFEAAGLEVDSMETRHSMYALAYRFEQEDVAFTFSADSEAFEGLAAFADGSDAFAHDCSFPDGVDVANHPTPAQLGSALAGHDYGTVYLTHLYPHTRGRHEEMVASVGESYDGDVEVARDGLTLEL